jgi:DNA-binding response OmpR family regulator
LTGRAAQVPLVEDDATLRQILARHLRAQGYDVDEAGSAEEAVTILAGGSGPAVVLLDINLPGDNGWDLLRGPSLAAAGSLAGRNRERAYDQPSPPR